MCTARTNMLSRGINSVLERVQKEVCVWPCGSPRSSSVYSSCRCAYGVDLFSREKEMLDKKTNKLINKQISSDYVDPSALWKLQVKQVQSKMRLSGGEGGGVGGVPGNICILDQIMHTLACFRNPKQTNFGLSQRIRAANKPNPSLTFMSKTLHLLFLPQPSSVNICSKIKVKSLHFTFRTVFFSPLNIGRRRPSMQIKPTLGPASASSLLFVNVAANWTETAEEFFWFGCD